MNHELINRFFHKQCTVEEAQQVAAYLKANPVLLEQYLSSAEWNSAELPADFTEVFWNEIWQNIRNKNKKRLVVLKIQQFAVAASVLLIAGLLLLNINTKKETSKPLAVLPVEQQLQHKNISNTTKKLLLIKLEDSSVIQLAKTSSVQFDSPFAPNKRDIYLTGEAKFFVAKNKKKPFTVYAGALATTALGTIFSVKKTTNNNAVTVKLFKGKVVIHATALLQGWDKDVYLTPGKQMNYNPELTSVAVNDIIPVKQIAAIADKLNAEPAKEQLTFNNAPLSKVMNKLALFYKVKIEYDTAVIDTMNFTGTISPKDSLPVILKAIGQMNALDVSDDSNGYIISKHHD